MREHYSITDVEWTDDCQGKKDYDADLVRLSTRYWPGPRTVFNTATPERGLHEIPGGRPHALAAIYILDNYEKPVIEADFHGDTFEEVKVQVEAWAAKVFAKIETAVQAALTE